MDNIYKIIRTIAKLNQEQFANELGTTTLSINRWENGKTEPNRMAQKQLLRFCLEHEINLGELIVRTREYGNQERNKQENGELKNQLILYHGSKKGISGNIAPVSRAECDFGRGFYMGTNALQPLTLICSETAPRLYTVALDTANLKILNSDIDLDWAMLIAFNRKEMERASGTAIYEKYAHLTDGYDVVTGYIANDRMYTELARFFRGDITDAALLNCLSALDLGRQYVAITEKACSQIQIIEEETLTQLELAALENMSSRRRKEGIRLADEIVKQHRREGRYFDEIVGG